MKIDLVFITYNRLDYTKLALASILDDPTEKFNLYIWDNASKDGTQQYLKTISDPRVQDIILSKDNVGQVEAVNQIWSSSKADLLGKLDNDCLVTPGWTRSLSKAHEDIEKLGVIAMWHFFEEDFDYERAKHKIQEFNGHKIFRHPWTCGTGLLFKKDTYKRLGPMKSNATTKYWLRMAQKGYINGWYYPLIYQEHMDDPKSNYCKIKDAESFAKFRDITFGLKSGQYTNIEGRLERREEIVKNLLDDPFCVSYYVSWRKVLRQFFQKLCRLCRGRM